MLKNSSTLAVSIPINISIKLGFLSLNRLMLDYQNCIHLSTEGLTHKVNIPYCYKGQMKSNGNTACSDGYHIYNCKVLAALAQMVACLPLVQQVRGVILGEVVNFHLKIFNTGARRGGDVHFLIARLYITVLD